MSNVKVTKSYKINANELWSKVRKLDDMHEILPSMIKTCSIEGHGTGSKRICTTDQGVINETIVLLDDSNKILKYSIDNDDAPLPVSNYQGTVTIVSTGEETSNFSWEAEYEPKGMLEGVFTELLDGFYKK